MPNKNAMMPAYGREADADIADRLEQIERALGIAGNTTRGALNVRDALPNAERPTMPTTGREADARIADGIDATGRAMGVTGAATRGALQVRDALDGATPPPGMMRHGGPQPNDFNAAFRELQAAMQDLDGDGVPDPIATAPQAPANAMAAMRGGPMTGPERADEAGMAHLRAQAGAPMGPDAPGQNAFAKYVGDAWNDFSSRPLHALQGLEAFSGLAGPASAARTAVNPASREMTRRELRSYTEAGSKRNTLDDLQVGVRRDMEAKNAFAAQREVQLSNTPHWQLQPNVKGPDGRYRFQKLPDDVKAAREKGIDLRRREAEATERAKKYNEGAN
jgi:hypothetical protein